MNETPAPQRLIYKAADISYPAHEVVNVIRASDMGNRRASLHRGLSRDALLGYKRTRACPRGKLSGIPRREGHYLRCPVF